MKIRFNSSQCLGIGSIVAGVLLAGCQGHSRGAMPSGAPSAVVSQSVLDQVDPPDAAAPQAAPATLEYPSDYELVWRGTGRGAGHWEMRRLTTGSNSGRVRVRMGEAGAEDAEHLQPAYIEQEMARLLVAMKDTNERQAEQLVQVMAEIRRLRELADTAAKGTMDLAGQLAKKELELRALRERAAQAERAAQQQQAEKK